ncbi:MAG: trehalose-phosphatase, partial [Syntrophobacteraceae bacterium]
MMVATSFERAEVIRLPGFWDAVAASERSLLALDYDGTLAPFHVDRMKAHPLPGIKRLIRKLAGLDRTEVAIISGRPLAELSDLVGLTGVTLVGSHGFETRAVTGESVVRSPSPIQLQGLEIAEKAVVGSGYAGRVEKKVASLALHTRGIGAARAVAITREVEQLWSQTAEKYDLECRVFKGGIELRSAGWHKGDV